MTAKSHLRGHEIEWCSVRWRYSDTGEVADYDRPCVRCGEMPAPEGYDACLGFVLGAESACCGHGVSEPWIKEARMIDIDQVKVGRETDALVAEAMGWKWALFDEPFSNRNPTRTLVSPDSEMLNRPAVGIEPKSRFYWCRTPSYSTDIAAAWRIDKPEWEWQFVESPSWLAVYLWYMAGNPPLDTNQPLVVARIDWDEVGMKAQAYALGRCRAILKWSQCQSSS